MVPRALLAPRRSPGWERSELKVSGLGPLGLLALFGVRVHWPEFWGSGVPRLLMCLQSWGSRVGWAVEIELTTGTLSDPTLNFAQQRWAALRLVGIQLEKSLHFFISPL